MVEHRGARWSRVALAGPAAPDGPDRAVVVAALAGRGLRVQERQAPGTVVWFFDVGADPPDAEVVFGGRDRSALVAFVGVGIEECPDWPARLTRWSATSAASARLPLFAVALGIAGVSGADSGLADLVDWVDEESAARAAREVSRGDAAERLAGLRVGSSAIRAWAGGRIHSGFRELAAAGATEAAALRPADVAVFSRWLSESAAAFEQRVVGAVAGQTAHLWATALVGCGPVAAAGQGPRVPVPAPAVESPPARPVHWSPRGWGAEDAVIVLLGASTGLGIGRLAAGSLAGWIPGWTALALAVAIGLGVAAGAVGLRRRVLLRNQARTWAGEVVADARARTEWRVAALVNGAEPAVAARVRRLAAADPDGVVSGIRRKRQPDPD